MLEQLDELAISRFLAEQTIAERNDRYLTHAFDEIRSEDERDFQSDLKSQVQAQRSKQFRYLLRMVEAAWWTAVSLLSVYSLWLIYNYNLAS